MKAKTFTPETIKRLQKLKGVQLASFPQRAFAFMFDLLICFSIFMITLLIAGIFIWHRATGGEFTTYSFTFNIFSWYGKLILNILIPVLYFGLSTWFTNGQTLGKKIMKIRVISLVNEKIKLWQAIERSLGYGTSVFELGIGFIQYFFHSNCQTSHDCLAETVVGRE